MRAILNLHLLTQLFYLSLFHAFCYCIYDSKIMFTNSVCIFAIFEIVLVRSSICDEYYSRIYKCLYISCGGCWLCRPQFRLNLQINALLNDFCFKSPKCFPITLFPHRTPFSSFHLIIPIS